ncbi:hypothetical protein BO86DRAFT_86165 [Aspergillus japonicus CBS 114.51]|uniref:Uncharacterized protein n=1 Tax=Aspergillus japonicus CBS 114.51 TaxID=1448312 RepID=A0A8T8X443_ASPJA|nr:hypothetical protein BO86DRAFT_86165 [Aspergillus japonicus CBS 114.51]RAH82279.1 hypothetical protein BO86DRAFT_86165 [Aspergillus japonicus CBS 114.51]
MLNLFFFPPSLLSTTIHTSSHTLSIPPSTTSPLRPHPINSPASISCLQSPSPDTQFGSFPSSWPDKLYTHFSHSLVGNDLSFHGLQQFFSCSTCVVNIYFFFLLFPLLTFTC